MKSSRKGWLALVLSALAVCCSLPAQAATPAGVMLTAYGAVKAVDSSGAERVLARRSPVFSGDVVVIGSGASAQVKFTDGAIMALKPDTRLKIDDYRYQAGAAGNASVMSLFQGGFRTISGAIAKLERKAYKVNTPVATIGIRGTFYETQYSEQEGLGLGVWDGGIDACNDSGCLDLGLGADHNFGVVPPAGGKPQGTDTPPPGIGDGMPVGEEGGGTGPAFDEQQTEDDMFADQQTRDSSVGDGLVTTTNVFEPTSAPEAKPFRAFLLYTSSDESNPGWINYGDTVAMSGSGDVPNTFDPVQVSLSKDGPWSFLSHDGNILISEASFCDCSNNYQLLGSDNARFFWGDWYTADSVYPASSGAAPLALSGQGTYVMGDTVSLSQVAGLSGTMTFTSPMVLEARDSYSGFLNSSSMLVDLDFDTGNAHSLIDLADFSGNAWHVDASGSLGDSGFHLSVDPGKSSYTNASVFAAGPVSVGGVVSGLYVGNTQVDAVMGDFHLVTGQNDPVTGSPIVAAGVYALTPSLP